MSQYKPGGRGHRILRTLSKGAKSLQRLREVEDCLDRGRERRKHWYVMCSMVQDGMIEGRRGQTYAITERGWAALATLNDGDEVAAGVGARVFASRAA